MKYSQVFGKAIRAVAKEIQPAGNALLHRAGFIRESTAGRYYFLPLGLRVRDKVCGLIEAELEAAGAQKILSPALHPLELWEESRRHAEVSFELMQLEDRRGRKFVLGGTAEEMIVDLVRRVGIGYRDLPCCLYQFSQKFRDELRARGGLLRTREFLMNDAYSFHSSRDDLEQYYRRIQETYRRIFDKLSLTVQVVEADNGYMGGDYSHEFVVEHSAGESGFFVSDDGTYLAHEEIARFQREHMNPNELPLPMEVRDAKRGRSIQDGVEFYGRPAWRQIKTIVYVTGSDEFLLVALRGDLDINESKLRRAVGSSLRLATEDEVKALGSVVGFVSPLNLEIRKVGDLSLESVTNFYTGADEFERDTLNVNFRRDFVVDILADIANAPEGALTESGTGRLSLRTGIEVANIFQLGTHYSSCMRDCTFVAPDGREELFWMGCYGIGIDRTIAAVAEIHHDERGLVWPEAIAPFYVHLVTLCRDEEDRRAADRIYEELSKRGVQVLYDDREISAGAKFTDADLLGIPHRVVVSKRSLKQGGVAYKNRRGEDERILTLEDLVALLRERLQLPGL